MVKQKKQNKKEKVSIVKNKQIKVCPKCGSTNITWDYGNAWIVRFGVNRDCCNDCGLKGNFPVIDGNKIKEFKKMLKNK